MVSNQCVVGLLGSVGLFDLCWRGVAEVAVEVLGVHPPSPGQADRSTQRHSSACRSKSQTRPGNPTITSQS